MTIKSALAKITVLNGETVSPIWGREIWKYWIVNVRILTQGKRGLMVHYSIPRNNDMSVADVISKIREFQREYPERFVYFDADRFEIVSTIRRKGMQVTVQDGLSPRLLRR